MSVKAHEAFSIDSFQDRLLWWDDFLGDQIKDEWATALVGSGTIAVVDAQTGGIIRLNVTTNAAADSATINWGNFNTLLVSKKVTIECRIKLSSAAQIFAFIGLWFNFSNIIVFEVNAAALANFQIRTRSGGADTTADSGIALDTDYHILRIEAFPTGQVHFYIDGVETSNSPITTNITASYLRPYLQLSSQTTAQKNMDVDYVVIRQEI